MQPSQLAALTCFLVPKGEGKQLLQWAHPKSVSSCFCIRRGLPQGPVQLLLWVASLHLLPLVTSTAPSTTQLFMSGNSRSPTASSENKTQPTRDLKAPICPMQLKKWGLPTARKWTHSLSKCRISFHEITYIWDCWEMLLLRLLARSLVTICASKLSYCQQLKKCGCQCVNTK